MKEQYYTDLTYDENLPYDPLHGFVINGHDSPLGTLTIKVTASVAEDPDMDHCRLIAERIALAMNSFKRMHYFVLRCAAGNELGGEYYEEAKAIEQEIEGLQR